MVDTFAPDIERLPWLTDDKAPRKRTSRWPLIFLGLAAMVCVAAAAFWFGMTQTRFPEVPTVESRPQTSTVLPAPAPVEPVLRDTGPPPMPQVEPAPMPAPVVIRMPEEVRPPIDSVLAERRIARRSVPSAQRTRPARAKAVETPKVAPKKSLQFSNPWESAGASGRMVRVGTYASLRQGKQAWSRLARAFPGMKRLPAVVTDIPSQRNGRVYYRLQIGTTSQAHSEVLCQRMKAIGQSCVVLDVAGARKGSSDDGQPAGL